ncbi:transcriptional repressor NrdR [Actinomyces sp. zg-332]|uniref:transcriptional regulator NrdR n=1 Tax=Actinomyces sp. zg-332 TaxID=2708340 RepID=UPI0014225794|nr:transcriptional regulator NrdR [Actinomyces sp. zg-332]QPK94412.1 transcriptional repressor NrdR [Actinomyces sp. zg-332]
MQCPFCKKGSSKVVDSRTSDDGTSIRRRRECETCFKRFTTMETSSLTVKKKNGVVEPFNRDKIIQGVQKSCHGRPVEKDELKLLAHEVEDKIRSLGVAQVDAHDIGRAILEPLMKLDVVAYLRFASVYSQFNSIEDFEEEIARLKESI